MKIGLRALALFLLLFAAPLTTPHLWAQSISQGEVDLDNLRDLNVDALSNEQILRISKELEQRNISLSEFETGALARGMRPAEVTKLKRRLQSIESQVSAPDSDMSINDKTVAQLPSDPFEILGAARKKTMAEVDRLSSSEIQKKLPVFGSGIFNSNKLSFAPSVSTPVPQSYRLGVGDELAITIWGAAQASIQVVIGKDGNAYFPDLGPISLNGVAFKEAIPLIRSRLSQIYAGLKLPENSPQAASLSVNVSKLRGISVSVVGNVKLTGTYAIPSLSTVLTALYVSGGPTNDGTYRNIQVIREGKVISSFDIYDFLIDGEIGENLVLQDQDIVKVDPYINRITVNGEVKRKGRFEALPGETLEDVLNFAGGFNENAYAKSVTLFRRSSTMRRVESVPSSMLSTTLVQSGDSVVVGQLIDRFENKVEIRGAVWKPGEYAIDKTTTLADLIEMAEGLKGDEFVDRSLLYRTLPNFESQVIAFSVEDDLSAIKLQKDDMVSIPSIFDLREDYFIDVKGTVLAGGTFPFVNDMTLKDAILLAGGLIEDAVLNRIEVARRIKNDPDHRISQVAKIFTFDLSDSLKISKVDEAFILKPFDIVYVRSNPNYQVQDEVRLAGEFMFPGSYSVQSKKDRISDVIRRAGGFSDDAYIEGAKLIRSKDGVGTVGIELREIMDSPGSKFDLLLERGDQIIVPKELQTVKISGAVLFPISVRHEPTLKLRDYIDMAGGFTDNANTKKVFVVYPNGEADRRRRVFLWFKKTPTITPGTEIIVPAKPEKQPMSPQERIAIISAIISALSLTAITINQLTR